MRISIDALTGWQADGFSDKGWFLGEFAASTRALIMNAHE
jgi:hypothetical protein